MRNLKAARGPSLAGDSESAGVGYESARRGPGAGPTPSQTVTVSDSANCQ